MLKINTTLEVLKLDKNDDITKNGYNALSDALKINKSIWLSDLTCNDKFPNRNEIKTIFERNYSQKKKPFEIIINRTTSLNLNKCSVTDKQLIVLANLLKDNKTVKTLNLNQNGNSDNAMKIILEMLKINKSLITVNLIGNDMSLQSWNELYNIQTYKRKGSNGYAKIVDFDTGFPNLQQNY